MKVGDRVILPLSKYKNSYNNPIWDGKYGRIVGTVIYKNSIYKVKWDNGYYNSYSKEDLKPYYESSNRINNLFNDIIEECNGI